MFFLGCGLLGEESHEGHSHEGGSPHAEEANFKYGLFVLLVVVLAIFAFAVFRNVDFILDNLALALAVFAIVYLVSRYTYLLQLQDYERAVIFRFGKLNRVGGPGWTLVLSPLETFVVVDLRTKTIDVPKQDVITKDGIDVSLDAVIYLKVKDDNASVVNSVIKIDDYVKASELFVLGAIRSECGKLTLTELISSLGDLADVLKKQLEDIARKWGVEVEEAVIQDIDIPKTVLEAMHNQKAAVQNKLARIEQAQGHQAEIEAVKAAASQLNDKTLAYYYVKALEKLGEGKSSKIIFPMELTNLARSLSGEKGLSQDGLEGMLKKYAPVVRAFVEKASARRRAKKARKRAKARRSAGKRRKVKRGKRKTSRGKRKRGR